MPRIRTFALATTIAALAACRTERVAAPPSPSAAPDASASDAAIGATPLYVVDGHRLPRAATDSVMPAAVRALSPDDIVSIEVLKGSAARARYGRDGENGVVLIMTRRKS